MIDDQCRCEGCLYGAHVTACEGGDGIETRKVAKGVYMIGGKPAVLAEYDRKAKTTFVTLVDVNDVERRFRFDPASGKLYPF